MIYFDMLQNLKFHYKVFIDNDLINQNLRVQTHPRIGRFKAAVVEQQRRNDDKLQVKFYWNIQNFKFHYKVYIK